MGHEAKASESSYLKQRVFCEYWGECNMAECGRQHCLVTRPPLLGGHPGAVRSDLALQESGNRRGLQQLHPVA